MEVKLTGQVNAEQTGDQYLGGTGGQVDYVRAGSRSPWQTVYHCLARHVQGRQSQPNCGCPVGPVTTARSEVDVIVTGCGVAELKGQRSLSAHGGWSECSSVFF